MTPEVKIDYRDFVPERPDDADVWSATFPARGCDEAVEILIDHGLTEANGPDDYYQPDGSVLLYPRTGERSEMHGALHGFPPKYEKRVGDLLARRVRGER
ncbi:hypothetical protein CcI49_02735 [Frankia sp. CcI49]|uniref:hypothetical protein n=1 Tax=Frankia sp. CcI49 TaxID=1745382 RepID=UPI000977F892|nr:hypothetical protein [Frankia sp. CcI49]ONH62311.1 hypothetical protein CcI49_02735 [Frankia sp. CcI49]